MKQFYPKPMVPVESRDSEGVPFASLESLWVDIWLKGDENGHVTIKIENMHIDTCRKIHWFSFRSMAKVTAEKRFRTVASPGAWPTWITARRQYILLVGFIQRTRFRQYSDRSRLSVIYDLMSFAVLSGVLYPPPKSLRPNVTWWVTSQTVILDCLIAMLYYAVRYYNDGLETSIVLLQHYLQLINFRRELRMAQCAMEVSQLQPPSDYISKCKLRLRSCFHCRGESAHAASVLFWCADKQIQRLRAKAVASDLSDAGFHHSPLFPQDN